MKAGPQMNAGTRRSELLCLVCVYLRSSAAFLSAVVFLAVVVALAPAARAHEGVDEQIAEVSRRIAREPRNAELYLLRGELHRVHRDWAKALADYGRAERLDPRLAAVDFARGRALCEAGRFAEASRALDRFLAREPAHADALVTRARARVALGRNEAAAEDYTRAIAALERPEPDYYIERARALSALGRAEAALRGLDEGIAALGPLVTLELLAVDLELEAGRTEAALSRLDRLASRSARKESWLARRGEVLERAGRAREAREAYAAALAAVEALPEHARRARATAALAARLRAALAR